MNYAADYAMLNDTSPPRARHWLRESLERLPPLTRVIYELPHRDFEIGATFEPLRGEEAKSEQLPADEAVTASEVVSEVVTTEVLERGLARHLGALLELAQEERFEDGMNSNLSTGLHVLFRNYSTGFVRVLEEQLKKSDISSRILVEVFYTLGQIKDDGTRAWRLATLIDFLKSSSPSVRDAAAVGLAYLEEKKAIPYLREAIERESSEAFREDLRAVVEQLDA